MAIKHVKVATVPDDGISEVGTDEWNDDHTIEDNTVTDDMVSSHTTTKITVPTTQLSGTVTNTQLAGSIDNTKLATDPLARANHTGTQAQSTVTDLVSDLTSKAPIASPTFTGTVTIPNVADLETAVVANTAKTGITSGQASAIVANTAKTGITTSQANAITANTAKTGITSAQASAISANTAKTGITSAQASAISANTAKVGITTSQANAISANTAKTGITSSQASAISANTAKISLTDNSVTLAKLAHGTANKTLGFDGSGNPAELSAGGATVVVQNSSFTSGVHNSGGSGWVGANSVSIPNVSGGKFIATAHLNIEVEGSHNKSDLELGFFNGSTQLSSYNADSTYNGTESIRRTSQSSISYAGSQTGYTLQVKVRSKNSKFFSLNGNGGTCQMSVLQVS